MRHTAFLVLGEDAIKRYVLMYGKGGSNDFFKLYNWNVSDNGLHIVSAFTNQVRCDADFCSGLEDEFNVRAILDSNEVAKFSDILFLAIKPKIGGTL